MLNLKMLNLKVPDGMKQWFSNHWITIALVIIGVLYFNQYAATQNLKKANEIQLQAAAFEVEKTQLENKVQGLESQVVATEALVDQKNSEIANLTTAIAEEKEKRNTQQLTTRLIDNDNDLLDVFKKAYPEFSHANNFGIVQLLDDVNQVTIPYLSIPLYFADAFIVEHEQLASYQVTEEKYGEVVTAYEEVTKLKDAITLLEKQRAEAWSEGYANGYKLYTETKDELLTCYKQPRIKIPSWWVIGATAAGGLAAGIYITK